jgi:hypothetical protein
MKKKHWGIILLLVAGLGLSLAWVVKFSDSRPERQARLQSSGNSIVLEQVTYGTQHRLGDDRSLMGRVVRALPPKWQRRFPTVGSGSIQTYTENDVLVCWLTLRDPKGKYLSPSFGHIQVFDEHGCLFHTLNAGTHGGMNILASPVQLPSFPRRQKEFTLRVLDWQNVQLAEFKVRNPVVVSDSPNWRAQPLPATRTNGDLAITLEKVTYFTNATYVAITPIFSVVQEGKTTYAWTVSDNVWSDSSGNVTSYGDGLCRQETAWKLQTKLFRNANARFAANELWRLPSRPVMAPGQVVKLTGTNVFGKARLVLHSLGGPGSYTFSNNIITKAIPLGAGQGLSFSATSSGFGTNRVETISVDLIDPFVAVHVEGLAKDQLLSVRMIDDSGNRHEATIKGGANRANFYSAKLPATASTIAVEFIVQQGRAAEFILAPPAPR